MCSTAAHRNMQWIHIIVALLNIMWIAFFLPPNVFRVFVKRRSTSISDEEILLREFCIQAPPDINWTSSGPAVYIPDNNTSSTITTFKNLDETTVPTSPLLELKVPGVTTPSETVSHSSSARPDVRVTQQLNAPNQHMRYPSVNECCHRFSHKRINPSLISSYYITDRRCPKTAVILVTKTSRKICVDPSSTWVRNTMKLQDAKLSLN